MDRIIRVRYTATVGDLASRLQAFALAGPFKTGEPTRGISESAIKRHKAGMMLSSESRNQALKEIIDVLRAHIQEHGALALTRSCTFPVPTPAPSR